MSTLNINWMAVVLLVIAILVFIVLMYAQFRKDSFDIRALICEPSTLTPSLHATGQFIALIVSTWGFIYLAMHDKLSEWYFGLYMAAWAAATAVNKMLDSKNDPNRRDGDNRDN